MADLAVIVPSRGRPRQLREMVEAVYATAATDVAVYLGLDDDDPADYLAEFLGREWDLWACRGERKSLSAWTNHLAAQVLDSPAAPRWLASLGDDHRPRTRGWDRKLIEAIEDLGGSGIAYGNDLLQGAALPTAWVVSSDIVRTLGWMMLPACAHMYVDNATLELGRALDRIVYRPDVIVEHLHPDAGKAARDASYRESNTPARYAADGAAFEVWRRDGLAGDVARLREATAVA